MKISSCLFALFILTSHASYSQSLTTATKNLVQRALEAEENSDYKKAITIHEEILKVEPNNIYSINSIAGLYGKLEHYQQEVLWAKKAIDLNPQYELAYLNYGNGLLSLGEIKAAENAFQKALQINPQSALANYSLGVLADSQNNFQLAITYYKNALLVDPQLQSALFNLGVDYANLKKYEEASLAFKQVLKINPKDTEAQKMLIEMEKLK